MALGVTSIQNGSNSIWQWKNYDSEKNSAANSINTQNPIAANSNTQNPIIPSDGKKIEKSKEMEKMLKKMGLIECETCMNRKYIDVSGDSTATFKTPTSINPEASFSQVAKHEAGHINNAETGSKNSGTKILYQTVQISTDFCPECGKPYASGGKATTKTASKSPFVESPQFPKGMSVNKLA